MYQENTPATKIRLSQIANIDMTNILLNVTFFILKVVNLLTLKDCKNVHKRILKDLLRRSNFTRRAARNNRKMLGSKSIVPGGYNKSSGKKLLYKSILLQLRCIGKTGFAFDL